MNDFIGKFQGFKVESIPDKDFTGPIIIPECMVEYLEEAEKFREKYNELLLEQLFNRRKLNEKK